MPIYIWLSDWVTDWVTDWLTDWLTEWVSEWVSECVCGTNATLPQINSAVCAERLWVRTSWRRSCRSWTTTWCCRFGTLLDKRGKVSEWVSERVRESRSAALWYIIYYSCFPHLLLFEICSNDLVIVSWLRVCMYVCVCVCVCVCVIKVSSKYFRCGFLSRGWRLLVGVWCDQWQVRWAALPVVRLIDVLQLHHWSLYTHVILIIYLVISLLSFLSAGEMNWCKELQVHTGICGSCIRRKLISSVFRIVLTSLCFM
jgi:hypothetical protein